MPFFRFLLVALAVLFGSASHAADWDSCADDLDRLRRAARDATDVAERVKSAAADLENCRREPRFYDSYGDRCSSKSSDYESEVSTLSSELDTVSRRVRDVSYSCDMQVGGGLRAAPPVRSSGNRMCDVMHQYVGRLPEATLIETCKKSMPEADCRKCLSSK